MLSGSLASSLGDDYYASPDAAQEALESERQFRDALGVAAVQWENLDRDYLRKWARELNVEELLDRLLDQAARLRP